MNKAKMRIWKNAITIGHPVGSGTWGSVLVKGVLACLRH